MGWNSRGWITPESKQLVQSQLRRAQIDQFTQHLHLWDLRRRFAEYANAWDLAESARQLRAAMRYTESQAVHDVLDRCRDLFSYEHCGQDRCWMRDITYVVDDTLADVVATFNDFQIHVEANDGLVYYFQLRKDGSHV